MKNNSLVKYGGVGIVIGVVVASLYFISFGTSKSADTHAQEYSSMTGGHMMPNGEVMGGTVGMDMTMDGMMAGLSGKTGDAFDKAFLSEMIVHHQGAVVMAEAVLTNSKRPELLKLAREIISAQTVEINMMKNWNIEWFK